MANLKIQYETAQNISITLAGLAATAARGSAYIDNSTDLYLDASVQLSIKLATGTPAADKAVFIWFYGSNDGTRFTDNSLGTNASVTLRVPTNFRGPFIISTPDAGGLVYTAVIASVANFFGGVLPSRWGIIVENKTGITLDATEANHSKSYRGIVLTSS